MALEALCGFDTRMSFSSLKKDLQYDAEVEHYTRNFSNNLELSVPPFPDVSKHQ
jgi:hypothetical protein